MNGAREIHAGLHLLDRQVVRASTGRLVCKVDDLELAGERPYVSAILAGPLALGPRLGGLPGKLMTATTALFRPEADPQPRRIPMGLVTELGSAITVGGDPAEPALERWTRENVISRIPGSGSQDEEEGEPVKAEPGAPRLSGLLGVTVTDAAGAVVGNVHDVRLRQDGPMLMRTQLAFQLSGLIVSPRYTGQLFGYERGPGGRAPWLVSALVRRLHRNSRFVVWEQIAALGEDGIRLAVSEADLAPLTELDY
ncbi:hypothetical protein ACIBG8_03905 [Nonomuraea sp. NPDC050556]|uniref:hypothetical protein n=1 Tax=Nonomuraea sp. NPDC050556 TaxID=3364369 RepID=UPI0037BD3591